MPDPSRSELSNLVNDIVAAPLGDVIASVGRGVAAAQQALDEASLAAVLELYSESADEAIKLLQAIGYRPTFYALPDTTGEVRIALRLGNGAAGAGNAQGVRPATAVSALPGRLGLNQLPAKLYATPVDAGYANHYGYTADISAKLTFRIVPVPPPQGADELRVVPGLVTWTVAASRAGLAALGLEATFVTADGSAATPGDDVAVQAQDPAAGAIRSLGEAVRLTVPDS